MSLLVSLRQQTFDLHQSLHVHPLLAKLQDDCLTLNDYHWCIRAFHLAYSVMQKHRYYTPPTPDVPVMEWLENDMLTHRLSPLAIKTASYPSIDNYSRFTGYLYVKQGSTLGGRVISKHLRNNLGLVEGKTNHFFAGFGEDTGLRWKSFLSLLEDPGIDTEEATAQAVSTFSFITQCCDEAYKAK